MKRVINKTDINNVRSRDPTDIGNDKVNVVSMSMIG